MASFDATRQVNGLGVDTRSDTVEGLDELLATCGVETVAWYGVRLFTDGWSPEPDAVDADDDVLAVELEATRRDPYRQLSRLFHLIGVRRVGDAVAWSKQVFERRNPARLSRAHSVGGPPTTRKSERTGRPVAWDDSGLRGRSGIRGRW
jgi:hypothetical protein